MHMGREEENDTQPNRRKKQEWIFLPLPIRHFGDITPSGNELKVILQDQSYLWLISQIFFDQTFC